MTSGAASGQTRADAIGAKPTVGMPVRMLVVRCEVIVVPTANVNDWPSRPSPGAEENARATSKPKRWMPSGLPAVSGNQSRHALDTVTP